MDDQSVLLHAGIPIVEHMTKFRSSEDSMKQAPHDEYTSRLYTRTVSLNALKTSHRAVGNLRATMFFAGLAIAFGVFVGHLFSVWWLIVPALAFLALSIRLQQLEKRLTTLSRAAAFYELCLERLSGRLVGHSERGDRFLDAQHVYAIDLDLFGRASVFQLLCQARTPMGQETLAGWLLQPAAPEVVKARQEAVAELAPRLDLREDIAVLGEDAEAGVRTEALTAWAERDPILRRSSFQIVALALSFFGTIAVIALLAYLLAMFGVFDFSSRTLLGLRVYFVVIGVSYSVLLWRFKARTDAAMASVDAAAYDLSLIANVMSRLERERFASGLLAALRTDLDADGLPASKRISKLKLLLDFVDSRRNKAVKVIGPMLLWDLHLSYAIEEWRNVSGKELGQWLHALAEIEALSSLAGYHYEHPKDVFPEFIDGPSCFDAEGLAHPLLAEARAVRNDVGVGLAQNVLIVSGSNMSGKSTLLRAIGVNIVLAQAGAPVRAQRLRLSPMQIAASIRVQDSLDENKSRFYAEILRLKQIVELTDRSLPVLFLIDEVLHGTNSHDRLIGAEALVRGLVLKGAVGLITTHDLALTTMVSANRLPYDNVHFEDYFKNGELRFDFHMRPGVIEKSNGLALMQAVGLPVS